MLRFHNRLHAVIADCFLSQPVNLHVPLRKELFEFFDSAADTNLLLNKPIVSCTYTVEGKQFRSDLTHPQ